MPGDDIKTRFARVVRAWREGLGLTQEQAAAKCDVSIRYWRTIEAGEPSIGLELCDQILRGLGRTWADFTALIEESRTISAGGAPASLHDRLDVVWRDGRAKSAISSLLTLVPPAEATTKARGARRKPRKA